MQLFKNLMSERVKDVSKLIIDFFHSEKKFVHNAHWGQELTNHVYCELKYAHLDKKPNTPKKQKTKKVVICLAKITEIENPLKFNFCFFEDAYSCSRTICNGLACKSVKGAGLKGNKSLFQYLPFWKYNYGLMAKTLGIEVANRHLNRLLSFGFHSQKTFIGKDNQTKKYGTYCTEVRFFPASPGNHRLIPKRSVQYIPIQATWEKKIFDKKLSVCKIYNGFNEIDMIVTHLTRVVGEKKVSPQDPKPYQMLEGYVLYPVLMPNKASRYTLELRKTLLLKDPDKDYTEAFKHPEWNKSLSPQKVEQEIQNLFEKIMEKTCKACNVKTMNMITNEKGLSFKTLYRNMTPSVFLES